MFRLVQLISIAAAGTVSDAATKTQRALAKQYATAASTITGSSKILHSKFEMPRADGSVPTYQDLMDHSPEYCAQCIFAGGEWVAEHSVNNHAIPALCKIPNDKLHALKLSHDGTKTPATVDGDVTYKQLFDGLMVCADGGVESFVIEKGLNDGSGSIIQSTFDEIEFKDGRATGKKGDHPYGWTYSWSEQDDSSEGVWAYGRTYLPAKYHGGLILTHKNDAATIVVMKVHGLLNRYFDNLTLKTNSLGKSGKIGLLGTKFVSFFMQQRAKYTATPNDFEIKFERATTSDIGLLVVQEGGVIVWVVIGCIIVCLCITACCIKHFCCKKKDPEDRFYQDDDLYSRV